MVNEIATVLFAVFVVLLFIIGIVHKDLHDNSTLNILTLIFCYGVFIMIYNFVIRFGHMITSASSATMNTSILSGAVCLSIIVLMYVVTTICSHILLHRGLCNAWHAKLNHNAIRLNN